MLNKYDDLKLKYQPDILVLGGSVNSKKLNAKPQRSKVYKFYALILLFLKTANPDVSTS